MKNIVNLTQLHQEIENCTRCPLYKDATFAVPGEGPAGAQIMFVGEAPGRYEDTTGRPFVGRAGQLLTTLIEATGLKRNEVFITSIVKHRPPRNRAPTPRETHACKYWLDKQLDIIKPKLIVTLGRFGMEYFLPREKITQVHGKIYRLNGSYLFPVYHPAYGLRGTRALRALKDDFRKLKEVILKKGFV